MNATEHFQNTVEAYGKEHGLFQLQSELIRALVKSVTVDKAEFSGPGFKIVIRNKPASANRKS